jgi:molybdate transport system substrate-binding protein
MAYYFSRSNGHHSNLDLPYWPTLCFIVSLLFLSGNVPAGEHHLRIAVASNFKSTLDDLLKASPEWQSTQVISGPTGHLYTQILRGAPFDIFLAADSLRPDMLEKKRLTTSNFIYTRGKLVLWYPALPGTNPKSVLDNTAYRLAIANPETAPYGKAAQEVLENLGLWDQRKKTVIRASNVANTYQYVASGNAQAGFIPLSFINDKPSEDTSWLIPEILYASIIQKGTILKATQTPELAQSFVQFLLSKWSQDFIVARGYAFAHQKPDD